MRHFKQYGPTYVLLGKILAVSVAYLYATLSSIFSIASNPLAVIVFVGCVVVAWQAYKLVRFAIKHWDVVSDMPNMIKNFGTVMRRAKQRGEEDQWNIMLSRLSMPPDEFQKWYQR